MTKYPPISSIILHSRLIFDKKPPFLLLFPFSYFLLSISLFLFSRRSLFFRCFFFSHSPSFLSSSLTLLFSRRSFFFRCFFFSHSPSFLPFPVFSSFPLLSSLSFSFFPLFPFSLIVLFFVFFLFFLFSLHRPFPFFSLRFIQEVLPVTVQSDSVALPFRRPPFPPLHPQNNTTSPHFPLLKEAKIKNKSLSLPQKRKVLCD